MHALDVILLTSLKTNIVLNAVYPLKPKAYDELKITEENKIKKLEEKYDKINNVLQNLIKGLSMVDESGKQVIAKQLIENGIFK